jgi:hypothetical protein
VPRNPVCTLQQDVEKKFAQSQQKKNPVGGSHRSPDMNAAGKKRDGSFTTKLNIKSTNIIEAK